MFICHITLQVEKPSRKSTFLPHFRVPPCLFLEYLFSFSINKDLEGMELIHLYRKGSFQKLFDFPGRGQHIKYFDLKTIKSKDFFVTIETSKVVTPSETKGE